MNFFKLISLCQPLAVQGSQPRTIRALVTDSRLVRRGDVFIALRGFKVDGHRYISTAADNGASAVIVEEIVPGTTITQIQVKDTRQLIGPLAQAFEGYPAKEVQIFGVTGTNGKTTVATLVHQVLFVLGIRAGLLGTIGVMIHKHRIPSHLTTPDAADLASLFRMIASSKCRYACMEVSSHAIDQQRINGLTFKVAGFTNLSHDHLDYHKTMEEYAKTKKKFFDGLGKDAIAIVNTDDPQGEYMVSDCQADIRRYGFAGSQGDSILKNNSYGLVIKVDGVTVESPLIGEFNAYNLALTYHACRALGISEEDAVWALSNLEGPVGRMQRIVVESDVALPVVIIDYAHTPDALKNVLKTLHEIKKRNQFLHVVFGAGGDRDVSKRPEMAKFAEQYADCITITSDNPRNEDPEVILDDITRGFSKKRSILRDVDRRRAILRTIHQANPNSIVLIAGKGHETTQEIKGTFHHFDDKEVAETALNNYESRFYTTGPGGMN
ncbi:MAG: UDP-N-acetylmuramoyl-L-alanyl-D-glutamate--2,6-diaminopimelate ligase [Balneolales bacterium]